MAVLRYYTSVFKKPDQLIVVVILLIFMLGITMMYQAAMLIRVQMLYIDAGLWIDELGEPHIGNLETYKEQVEAQKYYDIIPFGDHMPIT